MAKLPLPPAILPRLVRDDTRTLPAGSLLWRIYRAGGAYPVRWDTFRRWGPTATGRFDHQEPAAHEDDVRAIAYASLDVAGALAESFQTTRTIDRHRDGPHLVAFGLTRSLSLLDLAGLWLTRAGASQAIASGRRDTARAWSRAIHAAYRETDGVVFPSSMAGGSTNLALYERSRDAIPTAPTLHLALAHPGLELPLRRVAARLGYGIR